MCVSYAVLRCWLSLPGTIWYYFHSSNCFLELLTACCQVKKRNSEESSTQWTTGIAEVQLPIEYACLFNLLINCNLCFGVSLLESLYLEHYHAQFASWKWSVCLQGQSLSDLFCIDSVTAWCNGHYRKSFWGMAGPFILNKLNNCFLGCRYKLRNIEETEAAKKLLQEKRLMGRPKSEFSIPSSYSADYFQRGRDYAEKLRRGCWLFLIILHPFIIWVDWFFTSPHLFTKIKIQVLQVLNVWAVYIPIFLTTFSKNMLAPSFDGLEWFSFLLLFFDREDELADHPELYKDRSLQDDAVAGSKPADNSTDAAGRRQAATDEFMLERFRKRERHRVMRR